jgi:hypothetical protein
LVVVFTICANLMCIFFSFLKGALELAINHGGKATTPKELYSLLCRHKPVNTTMVYVHPRPMRVIDKQQLSSMLPGVRQLSYARFPELCPGASGTEALTFFTASLSPAGSDKMGTLVRAKSVHSKRHNTGMNTWLSANLQTFLDGTTTALALGSADAALVIGPGEGCVHLCTAVVPPLRIEEKSLRAVRRENTMAKKLSARTLHQVAMAEGIQSFATNGSSLEVFVPVALEVPEVAVKFEVTMASNAKSSPTPWSYSANDKFGYRKGHALRCNKPTMLLPPWVTEHCRRVFDLGNTAGHSKRSAASLHQELTSGRMKAVWNLRLGFSEARLKTMFSTMAQKKKKSDAAAKSKKKAAASAAAGDEGGGDEGGVDISDDVTRTQVTSFL